MERLLAVIRLALALCVDVLRSSEDPADAPPLALGFHHLTINELGITATGQGPGRMLVHVQEICAYSTDTRFTGAAGIDEQVALLQLRMAPRATVRSAGLLSRGASVLVELVGSAVLRLVAHGEDYFIQLPNLLLEDPLSPAACQPTLTGATPTAPNRGDGHHVMAGTLEVRCAATGMSAAIALSPNAVRGTVSRLQGQGTVQIAAIDGSLVDTVEVVAPEWEARGILFGGATVRPPIVHTVHLRKLEPMWMPHVWSAIRDALLDAAAGAPGHKKAETMAARLAEMLGSAQQDSGAVVYRDAVPCLPPCIQAERDAGRRLRYELKYVVCKVGRQ